LDDILSFGRWRGVVCPYALTDRRDKGAFSVLRRSGFADGRRVICVCSVVLCGLR
jgi:hypothetical protein